MTTSKRVREAAEDLVRVRFGETSATVAKAAGEDMRDWQMGSDRVERKRRAARIAVEKTKKEQPTAPKSEKIEIKVSDMRAAGKPGYVAKIVNGEKRFLQTASQDKYGGSKNTKSFEISEDGIYEIRDANYGGRKTNSNFIRVENGKIVEESENLNKLIVDDSGLPELEGSTKQVDWAMSIREKYLAKLKNAGKEIPKRIRTETSSKFYIDNRERLK